MRSACSRSRRALALVALTAILVTFVGCQGSDGPTNATTEELVLTEATIKVDGNSVDGQTLHHAQHADGTMRFEARLVDRHGNSAPGHVVRVEFEMPHMGMGMSRHTGTFMLYDNGMHGDLVPGDGQYCYEDPTGEFGCHGPEAQPGEYHYDFCGIDHEGHESNHMNRKVTLAR